MATLHVRNIGQCLCYDLTFMPFAAIYTLIHAFLSKHSHTKAAKAVKKAAKEVVILKDGIDIEGPQLDEIIAQWKLLKEVSQKASAGSSSSDSESDCMYSFMKGVEIDQCIAIP
jgi:hypothetical protein